RLFKQQRFRLVRRDGGFHLGDSGNQSRGFRRLAGFAEVAGEPFLEIFCLADVEQFLVGIEHPVDTRMAAARRQEGGRVESAGHQLMVSTIPCRTASNANSTSLEIESFSNIR